MIGIAHAAYRVRDMESSLRFYCELAGAAHAFSIPDDQERPWIEYIQVAKDQFIELFYTDAAIESTARDNTGYFSLCLYTPSLYTLKARMAAAGIAMEGDVALDPDGNRVRFVQDERRGIASVDFVAGEWEEMLSFYRDLFGKPHAEIAVKETEARFATREGQALRLLPGGKRAAAHASYQHLCIELGDIEAEVARLQALGLQLDSLPQRGKDTNLQAWIRDPDGNRIELMQIGPDSPQAKRGCEA